jgi:uncharacterized protein YkwD
MYKRLLVVIVMALSTLGATPLVATPAANASTASFAAQVEASIHKYTNARRGAHGRRGVAWSACVDRYAEGWAVHLRSTNRFYHRSYQTILRNCNKSYASENIAKYPVGASADAVAKATVRMWMNSPSHRTNLLSSRARTMGVGVQKSLDGRHWISVQNFAS